MEKIYVIANQTYVDPMVINWLQATFPHYEIDIICQEGSGLEDHALSRIQGKNQLEGLIREVKW